MKTRIGTLILLLAAAVCTYGNDSSASEGDSLETLLSVGVTKTSLELGVFSGGCTGPDDFRLDVDKSKSPAVLTVHRTRPDRCLALFIDGIRLSFDRASLKLEGKPFVLANPINRPAKQGGKNPSAKGAVGAAATSAGGDNGVPWPMGFKPGFDVGKESGWTATVNLQPLGTPKLTVRGAVIVQNGGVTAKLEKREPQGINPAILMLDVVVEQQPGNHTQDLQVRKLEFSMSTTADSYPKQVEVFVDDDTKVMIDVSEVH